MFYGFNYRKFFELSPKERVGFIPNAIEHILKEAGKKKDLRKKLLHLLKHFL